MPETTFQLPPQYAPHEVERRLYRRWVERGAFAPSPDPRREPYVIVIPPPNVTAVLHMGQGPNNVTQDVLIRFERMGGRAALKPDEQVLGHVVVPLAHVSAPRRVGGWEVDTSGL